MQKKPRWMQSVLQTAQEDLPPLPFARSDLRHDQTGQSLADAKT